MRSYFYSIALIFLLAAASGGYFFNEYWKHRYDSLIATQAKIYKLDPALVWSVIYEETYFSAWKIGAADEIGLMQVTPLVAREWAKETGFQEFEKQTAENVVEFIRDPKRNIQIGCWYLEKLRTNYRDYPAETAMTLAAYNAGASRVEQWTQSKEQAARMPSEEFITKIDIPSTRAYVSSILERYNINKGKIVSADK